MKISKRIICIIILMTACFLCTCARNVEVASVQLEEGKTAKLFLKTSDSCNINLIEVSENAGKLAVLNNSQDLYLWDIHTGKIVSIINQAGHNPAMMKFSPDGSLLATCGAVDGKIKFWYTSDGSLAREISSVTAKGPSSCLGGGQFLRICAIEFSPDGGTIVSADAAGNIGFWNVADGSRTGFFNWHMQESVPYDLKYDRKGGYLAIAGGETHYRQEARTGYRTYCCSYGSDGSCNSYCTETYTYYVTVTFYYPMVKIIRISDMSVAAQEVDPSEGYVNDMEFNADGSFVASNSNGKLLLFSTGNAATGFSGTYGYLGQVESFSNRGRMISSLAGNIYADCSPDGRSGREIITGEKNIWLLKYSMKSGIVIFSGGNTIRFMDARGEAKGLLSTTSNRNWVFIKPDGYYDGTPKGFKNLYWKIGDYTITMEEFGESFNNKGVLASLFSKEKNSASFDIASKLVGKVGKCSGSEILVYAPESSKLKMGDKLFVISGQEKIMLEVTFPMMTTARCRVMADSIKNRDRIKTGMPVFR